MVETLPRVGRVLASDTPHREASDVLSSIFATARAQLWEHDESWTLAPRCGPNPGRSVEFNLEIRGGEAKGFHLRMRPQGFPIAEYWYPSLAEALADAQGLFGVQEAAWSEFGAA